MRDLIDVLKICQCGKSLKIRDSRLLCEGCGRNIEVRNNKFYFDTTFLGVELESMDKIKSLFKRHQRLYDFLISIVSPVCPISDLKWTLKRKVNSSGIFLNLGSGNSCISSEIYNVDIFDYENVDVIANIESTPFKDGCVDGVFSITVLEHVKDPYSVIDEIYRILKPGGFVYISMPFMQGFHASPHDYIRFTKSGLEQAMSKFDQISIRPFGGPTSGLLWIFQEYIAILFSFGSLKLYRLIYILSMLLTWPLKFFDFLLIRHPATANISSGFVFVGVKSTAGKA